jgi:hypothetical protein
MPTQEKTFLFTEDDEKEFKQAFVTTFLANHAALVYQENPVSPTLTEPPVEDAEFLASAAWKHWTKILGLRPSYP